MTEKPDEPLFVGDNHICAADDCAEPTAWDWLTIEVDHRHSCCSPDCALEVTENLDERPDAITLHDPQYRVDRQVIDFDPEKVDIIHDIQPGTNIPELIHHLGVLAGGDFRPVDSQP